MRRVKECVAERKLIAWADAQGILHLKLNLQGRRGWPDRVFFLPGARPYFVELKAEGEAPRKLQEHIHASLQKLGYTVEVHTTAEEAVAFMAQYLSLYKRFWDKVQKAGPNDCWAWKGGVGSNGYGAIGKGGRKGEVLSAHRAAWLLSGKSILAGMDLMHLCNNKLCVNVAHLKEGSRSENLKAAYDDGLRPNTPRGTTHFKAKLTEAQALQLLSAKKGESSALCRKFGVSVSVGANIRAGRIWKHLRRL